VRSGAQRHSSLLKGYNEYAVGFMFMMVGLQTGRIRTKREPKGDT
jgi:hypothetical protein